jgi:hypothetical protein
MLHLDIRADTDVLDLPLSVQPVDRGIRRRDDTAVHELRRRK